MELETIRQFPGAGFFNINFWKALRHVPTDPATKKSNWCGLSLNIYSQAETCKTSCN